MSKRAHAGRADVGGRPTAQQRSMPSSKPETTADQPPAMGLQLRYLQRTAGNRATTRLVESSRSPADRHSLDAATVVQRDGPTTLPADSITGSVSAATVAKLRDLDAQTVEAELNRMPHDQRIKVAQAIYANPVAPGTQTAILMQKFRQIDSEALRIGQLNADYDRSYAAGNWHDIVMYLNGYDEPGIAERVAKWKLRN